jgi:hypothetical protein
MVPSLIPLIRKYAGSLNSNFFVSPISYSNDGAFCILLYSGGTVLGAALIMKYNRGDDVFIDDPDCAIASQKNKPVAILRYVAHASWQSELKRMFWSLQW